MGNGGNCGKLEDAFSPSKGCSRCHSWHTAAVWECWSNWSDVLIFQPTLEIWILAWNLPMFKKSWHQLKISKYSVRKMKPICRLNPFMDSPFTISIMGLAGTTTPREKTTNNSWTFWMTSEYLMLDWALCRNTATIEIKQMGLDFQKLKI